MTQKPAQWVKLYDSWGVKLFHSCGKPGDVVTVPRRDGSTSDETLKKCLSEGPSWAMWRVLDPGEALTPPPKPVTARRPLIRRDGRLLRMPIVTPDPPPHTDADAPGYNTEDD